MLHKIENLLLHTSDNLWKTVFVVQTAKSDDEQIRPSRNVCVQGCGKNHSFRFEEYN